MASLPEGNSTKSPIKQSLSFNNPLLESSPTSSFPSTEFDGHHLQPSHGPPWHQGSAVQLETPFVSVEDRSVDTQRLLPAFFASGMDNYGSTQFGSPVAGPCTWDNKISCMPAANGLAGINPLSLINGNPINITGGQGQGPVNTMGLEDYMHTVMEHMHAGQTHTNGEVSFRKMMMLPQLASELFKEVSWTPLNVGESLDPSNEGLSGQGVSLAASHCIPNLPADPGFADRAARFSPFGNMGYSDCHLAGDPSKGNIKLKLINQMKYTGQYNTVAQPSSPTGFDSSGNNNSNEQENRRIHLKETPLALPLEDSNNRTLNMPVDGDEGAQKPFCMSVNESDESMGQEVSSSCEKNVGCGGAASMQGLSETTGRKRKAGSQKLKDGGEGFVATQKELDPDDGRSKCQVGSDNVCEKSPKPQLEQSNSGNSGESTPKSVKESSKPPEAPKLDFIHVRARRGQATDSHSLAERVRREKISERMKFLQDLVPGCSKVTGKAVMLDEIINYVQSLQRQVEFLSMKLASMNPRVEFNIENLFGRERSVQPRLATSASVFGLDSSSLFPSLHPPHQQPHIPLQPLASQGPPPIDAQHFGSDPPLRRTMSTPVSTDAYMDSVSQPVSQAWDDELQSVVQMSFAQRQAVLDMQGQLFQGRMKVEH